MANIYAVLVGINQYEQKPLAGCIHDVQAFKTCLEDLYGKNGRNNLHFLELTGGPGGMQTRQNLINAFGFFNQATGEDYCLFYYSGHGSFSQAPIEFDEPSGYVQSFVCLDSRLDGGMDLMDKEMNHLIWQATKEKPDLNFIAITDCCHSGTITKSFLDSSNTTDRMQTPAAGHAPGRLEDYLGFTEGDAGASAYRVKQVGGQRKVSFLQGHHIHLAASMDTQTSKELPIDNQVRGAFTHSLIKCLYASGGKISYRDLVNQCTIAVRNLVSDQQPDLNMNGGYSAKDADSLFLSGNVLPVQSRFLVYRDPLYHWCINGGIVHGINVGDKVIVQGGIESEVRSSPAPGFSTISGNFHFNTLKEPIYAFVKRQSHSSWKISVMTDANLPEIAVFESLKAPGSRLVFDSGPGRMVIRADALGQAYVTLPGTDRSLIMPSTLADQEAIGKFIRQVESIAGWLDLKALNAPGNGSRDGAYSLSMERSGFSETGERVFESVNPFLAINDFYYRSVNNEWLFPAFRLKIINTSTTPIWVTTAYLQFDYAVDSEVFEPIKIAAGASAWLRLNDPGVRDPEVVRLRIDKNYQKLGYQQITEFVKLFISTEKMDLSGLLQQGVALPEARAMVEEEEDKGDKSRGIATGDREDPESFWWYTETLGFNIIKPLPLSELDGRLPVNVGMLRIEPHAALRGKVGISSSAYLQRSVSGAPPAHRRANNSVLEPFDISANSRSGAVTDVLEISGMVDITCVSPESPLIITLDSSRSTEELSILPLGYDTENDLYYPLGYTDGQGRLLIELLPEENDADGAITGRSFVKSVKLYLQKVIGIKSETVEQYPRLAIATLGADLEPVYNADLAAVQQAIDGASDIILLIHGIIGDTLGMVQTLYRPTVELVEQRAGKPLVLAYDYENLNTTIAENAALLKAKLEAVGFRSGHGKKLTIIAHSMGGLVSRVMIERPGEDCFVSKLIMLGTPNNGSPWADVRDMIGALLTFAINGAALLNPWVFTLASVGKLINGAQVTLKEMNAETGIYGWLNSGIDPRLPYVVIAGDTQQIIPDYNKISGFISKWLERLRRRAVYNALDGLVFHEPNDIAASVNSISQIRGSDGWIPPLCVHLASCNHLDYFNNPQVKQVLLKEIP
jgi:pimeloyl-ACP methyl ester carboxylesterase